MRVWGLLLLLLCSGDAAAVEKFVIVDVTVNGVSHQPALVSVQADGAIFARRNDVASWNIDVTRAASVTLNGLDHLVLTTLAGVSARVDGTTLIVHVASEAFHGTRIDLRQTAVRVVDGSVGAFLNYDLSSLLARNQKSVAGAAFEAVMFADSLSLASTGIYASSASNRFTRYETSLRRDFPDRAESLIVGDAISRSGTLARSFRFGGVSFGSNYSTRPDIITFALPTVPGEASVPTVADLLINGQRHSQLSVPPGPFEITNIPAISGSGEIQLLTRDALGRQQTLVVPFYVTPALLRPGLIDAGVEAGRVREDFGLASTQYGRAFARGTLRKGITATTTLEAYAESARRQRVIGAGMTRAIGTLAVANATVAASSGEDSGAAVSLSLDRSSRDISVSVRGQYDTRRFSQIGETPALHYRLNASVGVPLGRAGSVTTLYATEARYGGGRVSTTALTYSRQIGRNINVLANFNLTRNPSVMQRYGGLILTVPLDGLASASLSTSVQDGRSERVLDTRSNLSTEDGWAARARVTNTRATRIDVGASAQNALGQISADVGYADRDSSMRLGISGSIVAAGGIVRPVRQLGEAFAIISVPGQAGIDVFLENQRVATTDQDGFAVISRLRPYEANALELDTLKLSLATEIKSPKRTVIPARRAGVNARFDVLKTQGAMVKFVTEDGAPLSAGAEVSIGDSRFTIVGDGVAWIDMTGHDDGVNAIVIWNAKTCSARIPPIDSSRMLPRIGPLTCRANRP